MQIFARQIERVGLPLHFGLDDVMGFDFGVMLGRVGRDLFFAQVRPDDENVFDLGRVGQGLEHVQQVIEGGLAGHADQRFGFAPGVGAHARAPTCHRNDDLQGFAQKFLHGNRLHIYFTTIRAPKPDALWYQSLRTTNSPLPIGTTSASTPGACSTCSMNGPSSSAWLMTLSATSSPPGTMFGTIFS